MWSLCIKYNFMYRMCLSICVCETEEESICLCANIVPLTPKQYYIFPKFNVLSLKLTGFLVCLLFVGSSKNNVETTQKNMAESEVGLL